MNVKRCQSICNGIKEQLFAIQSELLRDYQSGDYLLSKIEPIIHDANVLKSEFEYLQKMQKGE